MTFLLSINGSEFREQCFRQRKEFNANHTIEEIKNNKQPIFYDYELDDDYPEIKPGDVAYLIDSKTQHPYEKCVVVENENKKLKLVSLIFISNSTCIIPLDNQVHIAPDNLVDSLRKHTDRLYHNGYALHAHRWLKEHDVNYPPLRA